MPKNKSLIVILFFIFINLYLNCIAEEFSSERTNHIAQKSWVTYQVSICRTDYYTLYSNPLSLTHYSP